MTDKVYLTAEGREELQREYDMRTGPKRTELAAKLKEAVAQGDLKENADYHDAKEQQAFNEGRILYLESLLKTAVLIEKNGKSDTVQIGSIVTIVEDGSSEEETYSIVGAAEANPKDGKISNESPIGSALLGKKVKEKIVVKTPSGDIMFKIKRIQ